MHQQTVLSVHWILIRQLQKLLQRHHANTPEVFLSISALKANVFIFDETSFLLSSVRQEIDPKLEKFVFGLHRSFLEFQLVPSENEFLLITVLDQFPYIFEENASLWLSVIFLIHFLVFYYFLEGSGTLYYLFEPIQETVFAIFRTSWPCFLINKLVKLQCIFCWFRHNSLFELSLFIMVP